MQPEDGLLQEAILKLKQTGFRYFFGGIKLGHLDNLLVEAVRQEIAGTGEHVPG